jgi:hypothetical protein
VQTGVLDVASNRFGPPPKIPTGGGFRLLPGG